MDGQGVQLECRERSHRARNPVDLGPSLGAHLADFVCDEVFSSCHIFVGAVDSHQCSPSPSLLVNVHPGAGSKRDVLHHLSFGSFYPTHKTFVDADFQLDTQVGVQGLARLIGHFEDLCDDKAPGLLAFARTTMEVDSTVACVLRGLVDLDAGFAANFDLPNHLPLLAFQPANKGCWNLQSRRTSATEAEAEAATAATAAANRLRCCLSPEGIDFCGCLWTDLVQFECYQLLRMGDVVVGAVDIHSSPATWSTSLIHIHPSQGLVGDVLHHLALWTLHPANVSRIQFEGEFGPNSAAVHVAMRLVGDLEHLGDNKAIRLAFALLAPVHVHSAVAHLLRRLVHLHSRSTLGFDLANCASLATFEPADASSWNDHRIPTANAPPRSTRTGPRTRLAMPRGIA
mmetsp:Transcript_19294/g.41568  ORF Transcript_19294/g.41568 Transcript_19294/m.41568 type:complete len:400 (+) Transcript_19294:983-2182(+)